MDLMLETACFIKFEKFWIKLANMRLKTKYVPSAAVFCERSQRTAAFFIANFEKGVETMIKCLIQTKDNNTAAEIGENIYKTYEALKDVGVLLRQRRFIYRTTRKIELR